MPHDFKKWPELTNSQMQIYYFESPHKQITNSFEATCTKVTDGDTIRVKTDFRDFTFPVRFINTAAPELDEPGGPEAKGWLEEQILGKDIYVKINPKERVGKWGRILGEVFHGGINFNETSIREGWAIPFVQRKEGRFVDLDKLLKFEGFNF